MDAFDVASLWSYAMTTTERAGTATARLAPAHERGTPGFRRLGAALWLSGMATFVLVYSVQGLLPGLSAEFGVGSSMASLALSATTGTLALAVLPLSAVTESWGRTRVMTWALGASAVLALLAPFAPSFGALVAVRALQGITLAALPALSMAHLTHEVTARHLGGAVGLLIAGNTLGGLSGRLIAAWVAEAGGWRAGLAAVGAVSVLATVAFRFLLPEPTAPTPQRTRLRELGGPLRRHLADPGLLCLFGMAFLLMGAFVTVYNYLGFRLLAPPFSLPGTLVGLVFLGYLAGSWASTRAGLLGDRFGRRPVLWVATLLALAGAWVTLPDVLGSVLAGLLLVTVGFFGAHSVASSWVGRRSVLLPGAVPAQASSLYLVGYYAGSSAGGAVGGIAYDQAGWFGVVCYVSALLAGALVLALALRRIPAPA
ncbi:MFS transporter, YNFM family, putative membrane transport protein [Pseudonocardia ammonioxydans]|uniref:MFS transporter, YNFM family, putative membrane transport protein n=2 Tax=Pseudonocardia ammonioxydans TaxID=260086 RepID=A0A1I4XY03_PSUAM|nr:MFS transporter, YNFM family, putative membrane transport protein [Pseudonocardia ammonioxydans]